MHLHCIRTIIELPDGAGGLDRTIDCINDDTGRFAAQEGQPEREGRSKRGRAAPIWFKEQRMRISDVLRLGLTQPVGSQAGRRNCLRPRRFFVQEPECSTAHATARRRHHGKGQVGQLEAGLVFLQVAAAEVAKVLSWAEARHGMAMNPNGRSAGQVTDLKGAPFQGSAVVTIPHEEGGASTSRTSRVSFSTQPAQAILHVPHAYCTLHCVPCFVDSARSYRLDCLVHVICLTVVIFQWNTLVE